MPLHCHNAARHSPQRALFLNAPPCRDSSYPRVSRFVQEASPEIMQQFEADAHPEVIIAMASAAGPGRRHTEQGRDGATTSWAHGNRSSVNPSAGSHSLCGPQRALALASLHPPHLLPPPPSCLPAAPDDHQHAGHAAAPVLPGRHFNRGRKPGAAHVLGPHERLHVSVQQPAVMLCSLPSVAGAVAS